PVLKTFNEHWFKQARHHQHTHKHSVEKRVRSLGANNTEEYKVLVDDDQIFSEQHAVLIDGGSQEQTKHTKKLSLVKAIYGAYGTIYFWALPQKLAYDVLQFTGPVFLSLFIGYAADFNSSSHALRMGMLFPYFSTNKKIMRKKKKKKNKLAK
ncbi:hypothetical protein RFI_35448, partial [Reticulomyxa filosa]